MFEKFLFKNFEPTEDLAYQANTTLDRILDLAPADASCTAVMTKVGDHFTGKIEIRSQNGAFKSHFRHKDPYVCIENLEDRLQREIQGWKKMRLKKFADSEGPVSWYHSKFA